MSETVTLARRYPLDGLSLTCDTLTIRPVEGGKIMLQRSNTVADKTMEKLGELCDFLIPLQVCRKAVGRDGAVTTLCTAPNMWIILCEDHNAGAIAQEIEAASGEATITAAVVTDQFICLDIEGRHARALLAKGCALDLDNKVFSGKHVARTLLAQTNIVIWRTDRDGFRLMVDVSLASYLSFWLEEASAEFLQGQVFSS